MRFKTTYTFEEEGEYASKEEAQKECEDAAEGIADGDLLTVVSVKVEEITDA